METNKIINEMFHQSPLQKEWNPKTGDLCNKGLVINFRDKHSYECYHFDATVDVDVEGEFVTKEFKLKNVYWKPRQEDLQEIFAKSKARKDNWKKMHNFMLHPYMHINDASNINELCHLSEYWTLRWCLFVHREVYGLVWNWEKKKWKPVL
jgi:hypothetical protein